MRPDLIPGGSHTYSKGDDRWPRNAPRAIVRGKGSHVWADDGREFIDWSMGINNVLIGHAEDAIDDAAVAALRGGQAFGRPSDLEEQAAEAVLGLFPSAEMIKFCKNGSDANNAAIKLARAMTGRHMVAYDETAPFFSTADWFVGNWPSRTAGTLSSDACSTFRFRFNDVESLSRLFPGPFGVIPACVILELARTERPTPRFLQALRTLTRQHGALLIIDEVVTGYRYALHGLHHELGIDPDLFTLGKGIANGYSLAALCGKREYLTRGAEDGDVFLLSTTNGAERSALAAAIATAQFYTAQDVCWQLSIHGGAFAALINERARLHGLQNRFSVSHEFPCRPLVTASSEDRMALSAALIRHGVLVPPAWVCPCFRHSPEDLAQTSAAIDAAFESLAALKIAERA